MSYPANTHGFDRWLSYNGSMTLTENGIELETTSVLTQFFEPELLKPLNGRTLTASVLTADGTLYTGTGTYTYGSMLIFLNVGSPVHSQLYMATELQFYETSKPVTVAAVKLELGSQQTLARKNDAGEWEIIDPPNYDLQYALCSLYNPVTGKWTGYTYSNPNLLDNAYFLDPINQRVVTEWSNGYGIDRWVVSGTATLGDNGISLKNDQTPSILFQRPDGFNFADGKIRTISYLDGDGNLYYGPFTAGYTRYGNFWFAYDKGDAIYIRATDSVSSIQCVKLELGPVQTLAHKEGDTWVLNDPPPNKAQELLKCQRYQIKILGNGGSGIVQSSTTAFLYFPIPVELRKAPSIIHAFPATAWTAKGDTNITSATLNGSYNGKTTVALSVYGDFSDVSPGTVISSWQFAPLFDANL